MKNLIEKLALDTIGGYRVYAVFMQIGELAQRVGVHIQTIRFYEREKLLPTPARRPSGYRVYSEEDRRRLQFIRQAKALGFSLEEIREILLMRAQGTCPCGRVVRLAERHLGEVRQTIRRLAVFEGELARAVKRWKKAGQPKLAANEFCILIERAIEVPKRARADDSLPLDRLSRGRPSPALRK